MTALLLVAVLGCSPEREQKRAAEDSAAPGASAQAPETRPAGWDLHVASRTSGPISRTGDIRVHFVRPQVPDERVGHPVESPLRFDPPISGVATWQTTRELRFLPDSPLPSGARYRATLALSGDDLPSKPYAFAFSVIRQDFEVSVEGLVSDPDDHKRRILHGLVTTADAAPSADVEKLLVAEHMGDEKQLVWEHAPDERQHRFSVLGIERQPAASTLTLSWDGSAIGLESRGRHEIEVPPLGLFKLTSVKAVAPEGGQVLIHFSDNLDPQQDLAGMVRIGGREVRLEVQGNLLRAFPEAELAGEVEVEVAAGVRNTEGATLEKTVRRTIHIEARKPGVRFVGKGVILPDHKRLSVPFEAVAVDAVQVTAFRVYDDNTGRFLQDNSLAGSSQLQRVGRHLWRKTIELEPRGSGGWERYALDLTELLERHRGTLLRLTLSINRANSTYTCPPSEIPPAQELPYSDYDALNVVDRSNWDSVESSAQPIQWKDKGDPCKDAYYRFAPGAKDSRNFLASNIGLLAKRGDETALHVFATDLASAEPLGDVSIEVFNFQDQRIATARTDAEGRAHIELDATPFYLQAEKAGDRGYLKLDVGSALATSHFDVGGERVRKGIKGHLYGERGVWRPGDPIHLGFVVHDPSGSLPEDHPVTLTLHDPRGQRVLTRTHDAPVGGFYTFELETEEDAPTGRWTATARLGGLSFSMPVRVETVIPNRLKAELEFGSEAIRVGQMPLPARLFGQWLHGADAAGLKADVRYQLRAGGTEFTRHADFVFDDPTRQVESELTPLFEGVLDEAGKASFELTLPVEQKPPGRLQAEFTTRVFEESGAFSSERLSVPFDPYSRYVGLRVPPGDRARGMLLTDRDHTLEIASVDPDGNPISLPRIDVRLYKLDWRWWWDQSRESLAQYASATHKGLVAEGSVSTRDGVGRWTFRIDQPEWGRYLLRACDAEGGHCSGRIVYIDWPGWAGRAQEQGGIGATALTLTADAERYAVGDTARITLPVASQGRMLLGVETGSRILSQRWIEAAPGETQVEIPITKEMVPTAYVSVVLLQPHRDKGNDRPIRLYGYLPLAVEDPETHLDVQLVAPDEIRPRQRTRIEVAEGQGRPMAYTIAIVDEGLLGLTRYRTPNLHSAFFAREALGIRSWDLFDFVVGAYGGELERLLAVGGGAAPEPIDQQKKKRRFPPVVRFLGPFSLEAGGRGEHDFELPEYIGAVRIMVVAGGDGAYGSTGKSVFVRDDVMLLATLPRVLGPGEDVALPVAVFATTPDVEKVDVSVATDAHFSVAGTADRTLEFTKPGDQIAVFDLHVGDTLGQGHVAVRARAPGAEASQEIAIDVRSPNRETLRQTHSVIEASQSWSGRVRPHGLPGTNEVALELSSVPPLNLERRLEYLIRYPYGCVEQLTSSLLPQLFLPSLASLGPEQQQQIQQNIEGGIERMRSYQRPDGSFAYWPGAPRHHDWATSYAGHFLVEASRQGYHVPVGMIPDWIDHQRSLVQGFVAGGPDASFDQAYRLYTLALAGEAEIGAMNRLREADPKQSRTRWMLAAAYRTAGLPEAAEELVRDDDFAPVPYTGSSRSFGSRIRDESIFLMGAVALERFDLAERWVESLSASLASDRWHSTQSTAWALLALSRYAGSSESSEPFVASYRRGDGQSRKLRSESPILRVPLPAFDLEGESVEISNESPRRLYATLSTRGIPRVGDEEASASGLRLEVRYTTLAGEDIDVSRLEQGRDFVAHVTVVNTRDRPYENLALTQIVPSGWEIHDPRFAGKAEKGPAEIDYQDVRDDRVYSYFALDGGKRKTFRLLLNAAYRGRYYLPAVSVEAMYDGSMNARNVGRWIEIVGNGG